MLMCPRYICHPSVYSTLPCTRPTWRYRPSSYWRLRYVIIMPLRHSEVAMLSVMIHGCEQHDNCGFLDHTLLVTLSLSPRSALWQPVNVYAVLTDSMRFHVEQIKKWCIKSKLRVIICTLDVRYCDRQRTGLCVPPDEEWPFDSFSRIDYESIRKATSIIGSSDQQTDASVITLWRKS